MPKTNRAVASDETLRVPLSVSQAAGGREGIVDALDELQRRPWSLTLFLPYN